MLRRPEYDEGIRVCLPAEMKELIEVAASDEAGTLSQFVRSAIADRLASAGFPYVAEFREGS